MDFLKIAGYVLIVFSTTLAGIFIGRKEKLRINDLDELRKSLNILISEISFSAAPLKDAMCSAGARSDKRFGIFYTYIAGEMEKKNSIFEAWETACKLKLNHTFLKGEDKEKLALLKTSFDGFDKELIIRNIGIITDYIEDKKEHLYKEAEKNGRLFRSLGVLAGLLIVIILI